MNLGDIEEKIALWRSKPEAMVWDLWKAVPDPKQLEALEAFPHRERLCLKASKGVGKTCVESWIIWNFLLTRPNPKIACTSIDAQNLADNLWTELAAWRNKSDLLKKLFTWTKTRIFFNEEPETWWCSARTWSKKANKEELGNTLAGLHADYILFVLDETGDMPQEIMVSADAALSSCIEGHIVQAGNPSKLEGPLYRACIEQKKLWHIIEITSDPEDPKRSPRISMQWAQQMIDDLGRDNNHVKVNVLGQFPSSSLNALIGPDEVDDAMRRDYREQDYASFGRVLGIDVALEGDDASVIFPRQGLQSFTPSIHRGIDGTIGANIAAAKWRDWDVDTCFIDNTGGFGSSWIDNLRRLGYSPVPIHFSQTASVGGFLNKRAEMLWDAVQWIKGGGALPPNRPQLKAALTKTTYTHVKDKLVIEPKPIIKQKLGYSPDELDAFILTFGGPVIRAKRSGKSTFTSSYDPLDSKYIEAN